MIHLDFETFSNCPIKSAGTSRYAEDDSTEILCASWTIDKGDPDIWIQGDPAPHRLFNAMTKQKMISIFTAFEIRIWLEVGVKRMGWPVIPDEWWFDTQADALALGLPADLETLAIVLGCAEKKDPVGKRLIKKLCCPVKPTKKHPTTRWTKPETPDDFLALYQYCKQDVRTERDIRSRLHYRTTETGIERQIYLATVLANGRGIPVDTALLCRINALIAEKIDRLTAEMQKLTGHAIATLNQNEAIRAYLNENCLPSNAQLPDMQGDTLLKWYKKKNLNDRALEIIRVYMQANYASIAKFKKMAMQLCKDGTIKDNHRYHGAATGRDAGMGVQIQNLPRASVSDPEFVIDVIMTHGLDEIEALFGNVLELASALCRPALCAPGGMTFFNADLGQIEARMTGWIAKEDNILQTYRDGKDAYKEVAAKMYKVPYDEVTKLQRQVGKVFTLLAGFQGGAKAVMVGALNYGLTIEEKEAQEGINAFRESRTKLVKTWAAFGEAARNAILEPGVKHKVETNNLFSFLSHKEFLFMHLPNGRVLSFPYARWEMWMMPWGKEQMCITHMWVNTMKGSKWERRGLSGASLMQSAVQGLSRDILMEAMLRLEDAGYPHIMRVHDELTALVPNDPSYSLDFFAEKFVEVPTWCRDLPIICDPWKGKRFRK